MRPDLVTIFPAFGTVQDFEKIKNHPVLLGHPKNIAYTFRAAVISLDDTEVFINDLEILGAKHDYELKKDHLNVSCSTEGDFVRIPGESKRKLTRLSMGC